MLFFTVLDERDFFGVIFFVAYIAFEYREINSEYDFRYIHNIHASFLKIICIR